MPKPEPVPFDAAAERAWSERLDSIIARLAPLAEKSRGLKPYWMERTQEIRCRRCAGKSGISMCGDCNQDSQQFCEKCRRILDHFFTDWGKREELECSADDELASVPVNACEALTLINILDADLPRCTERWKAFGHLTELRPLVLKIEARLNLVKPNAR